MIGHEYEPFTVKCRFIAEKMLPSKGLKFIYKSMDTKLMKALKALVWQLSWKPIKGIDDLKKEHNNIRRTSVDEHGKGRTCSGTD